MAESLGRTHKIGDDVVLAWRKANPVSTLTEIFMNEWDGNTFVWSIPVFIPRPISGVPGKPVQLSALLEGHSADSVHAHGRGIPYHRHSNPALCSRLHPRGKKDVWQWRGIILLVKAYLKVAKFKEFFQWVCFCFCLLSFLLEQTSLCSSRNVYSWSHWGAEWLKRWTPIEEDQVQVPHLHLHFFCKILRWISWVSVNV